tara:strand:- start:52 stop:339 length:288 start_codon:yes stop_codon:yes gene_type:complete
MAVTVSSARVKKYAVVLVTSVTVVVSFVETSSVRLAALASVAVVVSGICVKYVGVEFAASVAVVVSETLDAYNSPNCNSEEMLADDIGCSPSIRI